MKTSPTKCAFCSAPATFSLCCEFCGNYPKKCDLCGKKGAGRCGSVGNRRPTVPIAACVKRYKEHQRKLSIVREVLSEMTLGDFVSTFFPR